MVVSGVWMKLEAICIGSGNYWFEMIKLWAVLLRVKLSLHLFLKISLKFTIKLMSVGVEKY